MANEVSSVDILIIGGGLTGIALLLALNDQPYRTLLVDTQDPNQTKPMDSRTLALAPASTRILQSLNLWSSLAAKATPIERIHVSNQGHFGVTRLTHSNDSPLGYVIELQHLNQCLATAMDADCVLAPARLVAFDSKKGLATLSTPSGEKYIQTKLLVAADGTASEVRRLSGLEAIITPYPHMALVATLKLARSHQHIAFERFTPNGPLALLPMLGHRCSLIWSLPRETCEHYLNLEENLFLKTLQTTFGYRLGRFIGVTQRTGFPLQQVLMPKQTSWPYVFVGNAAHTLHPVAGQGFNLGLRDVAMLAQCIVQDGLTETMLNRYADLRTQDQRMIIQLTHGLVQGFGAAKPGFNTARGLGLMAVDVFSFLKTELTYCASGFTGQPSNLLCGLPLTFRSQHESI